MEPRKAQIMFLIVVAINACILCYIAWCGCNYNGANNTHTLNMVKDSATTKPNMIICDVKIHVLALSTDNWCNNTFEAVIISDEPTCDSAQVFIDSILIQGKKISINYETEPLLHNVFRLKMKLSGKGLYTIKGTHRAYHSNTIRKSYFEQEFVSR